MLYETDIYRWNSICVIFGILELILPVQKITFARMLSLVSLNLLGALTITNDVSICI